MNESLCLLTPTWLGDKVHFDLLRTSIERSALAYAPHDVVVHTEDLGLFSSYAGSRVRLIATEDVLPGEVEAMRRRARHLQARFGRAGTRILSSISRYAGLPRWVRYTGWQVQQIAKLAMAARSDTDTVVLLDSDVIVTRHAQANDFLHPGRIVCFGRWMPAKEVGGKVAKWNRQAHVLLGSPFSPSAPVDAYFDTPFVFHPPTVRRMLAWLERRHGRAWWEVLLAQPPRRWSEFGTYRVFLRSHDPGYPVEWRSDHGIRYLFDARDPYALRSRVGSLLEDSESHYIIIHSQSSGRGLWRAEDYAALLMPMLEAGQ